MKQELILKGIYFYDHGGEEFERYQTKNNEFYAWGIIHIDLFEQMLNENKKIKNKKYRLTEGTYYEFKKQIKIFREASFQVIYNIKKSKNKELGLKIPENITTNPIAKFTGKVLKITPRKTKVGLYHSIILNVKDILPAEIAPKDYIPIKKGDIIEGEGVLSIKDEKPITYEDLI